MPRWAYLPLNTSAFLFLFLDMPQLNIPAHRCLYLRFKKHLTMSPARLEARDGFATSFPVGVLHPLQHGGLARRSPACLSLGNASQISQRKGNIPKVILRAPTASGSQTRRIFFPMSMTCREGLSYDISIHALKYPPATLIQGVASALRHQLFEHASHCFYSIHQMI